MKKWMGLGALAALLALGACDSSSGGTPAGGNDTNTGGDTGKVTGDTAGGDTAGGDTTAVAKKESHATYNAGFALNFVPYAEERVQPVVDALKTVDADVLCLQEVWQLADITAITEGVKATFPHEFHVITDAGEPDPADLPACSQAEAVPLKDCAEANDCANSGDLTGCVVGNCGAEFGALSPECTNCLASNLDKPTLDEIFQVCAVGSAKFSYEGRNGLILLSKLPLSDTDHLVMDSFQVRRAVLTATVDSAAGKRALFCTHLTASLSELEYGGEFGTWEEEQAHQVDQLTTFIGDKAPAETPIVLMGDMNAGPKIGTTIDGEAPEVYQKFVDAGFEAPYVLQDGSPCTWCKANTLVDETSSDRIIDHVFLKGFGTATTAASRILDGTTTIDVGGTATETNLSDHFGVRVEIESK